jgi:hypothetical protein
VEAFAFCEVEYAKTLLPEQGFKGEQLLHRTRRGAGIGGIIAEIVVG